VINHTAQKSSTDEVRLFALLKRDAAILRARELRAEWAISDEAAEPGAADHRCADQRQPRKLSAVTREKLREAGRRSGRARQLKAQAKIQPVTVSPVPTRRQSHG
jgi:hypothetical protein